MIYYVIEGILVAVVMFIVGSLFGYQRRKATAEREIGSAEEEATRIVNDAYKSAESKKREALVEAKEEILKARNEYEQEEKERRADLQKQERRLQQKEENLDRKTENMEKKEEHLANRLAKLEATQAEAERIKQEQVDTLERISGFTAEEAKTYLLDQLEADVTHESAMKIKEIEARFKDEADTKAREIISLAIQRCAADHVAEATVSVVPLPNDEMKGRIIGREGRNIRTLETLTGVDLIIDDTPEAITVSCFDPVRRRSPGWLWRSSFWTAASIPPALRRWWRRPSARWTPPSRLRVSGPSLRPTSTACTPSWSSCWAVCATAPATARMC